MDDRELPGGESLDFIFRQIAEKDDESAIENALKIINTANDRELRSSVIKKMTEYQTATDSVAMHEAMEDTIQWIKRQYALILIQGFRFGQGYQQKISNASFREILENAAKASEEGELKDASLENKEVTPPEESEK